MTEIISNMKKHTCPTCGGQLIVNEKRQMYECPFCGVSFDYEYFREDDVLERAGRALTAGEFQSAKEAYDFMLTKEPSNFEALRGKILISANMRGTSELRQANRFERFGYAPILKSIDNAIEHSLEEHKGYFSKMKELFETGSKYKEEIETVAKIRAERKTSVGRAQRLENSKTDYLVKTYNKYDSSVDYVDPKFVLAIVIVIYVVILFFGILIGSPWSTNPYTKSASEKETKNTAATTIRSEVSSDNAVKAYFRINGMEEPDENMYAPIYQEVKDVVNGNGSSAEDMKSAHKEAERQKKEENWERNHKARIEVMWVSIILSTIVAAGIAAYMIIKIRGINAIDEKINVVNKRVAGIDKDLDSHVRECGKLRGTIQALIKELSKMDPMPDKQFTSSVRVGRRRIRSWK